MYECPSCGAGLRFDPEKQLIKCDYCGNEFRTEEIEKLKLKESIEDSYEATVYRCKQCGAKLITTEETIATFCSYCGSAALLKNEKVKKHKPKYVIPFSKTKEECVEAYRKKLKNALFAPNDMAEEQQVEKIRGIYMPYWIYSFNKKGPHTARGQKYNRRVGDYVYYDDYAIDTNLDAKCSGITHDASANFSDELSECIAPFSMKEKKEFSPTYLSGFYADSEDVEKNEYTKEMSEIVNKQANKKLREDYTYRRYNAKVDVNMDLDSAEIGLFPVYFLATKNKKGDRISYAVINGQTGKVAAEIPIDFKKYIITSIVLAIIIFIMLNMCFTVTPAKVVAISVVFNIISLIILSVQSNKIFMREKEITKEIPKKIKKIHKPIIGLVLALAVAIINPVYDLYYYSVAIISIIMTIWSFKDIIEELNLLTTRKLPQLEKRGGDENE